MSARHARKMANRVQLPVVDPPKNTPPIPPQSQGNSPIAPSTLKQDVPMDIPEAAERTSDGTGGNE